VVLTRAPEDNARLRAALGGLEAEIVDHPCIATESVSISPDLAERIRRGTYTAAIFVSRNAVESFFTSGHFPSPPEVVAIGPSTAESLTRHGWHTTAMPSSANLESAITELGVLVRLPGPVLYVRGDLGEDTLPEALRRRGARVDVAVTYRTRDAGGPPLPGDPRPTLVVFASPSAVRSFRERSGSPKGARALAIGGTTAHAAAEAGFEVDVAPSTDVSGLASAIRSWVRERTGVHHA
jgi:uroporphyrinogen-III synthase